MRIQTPRDIGALLRARRRAMGLDQRALAERAGVSRLWISEVERGKPGASIGLVLHALNTLGVVLCVPDEPAPVHRPPIETPDINAIVAAARRR